MRQRASNARMRELAAGWLIPIDVAAALRLPASATATISRKEVMSTSGVITIGYMLRCFHVLLDATGLAEHGSMTIAATSSHVKAAAAPLIVAALAVAISSQFPLLGPLLLALVAGAVVANTPWAHHRHLAGQAGVSKSMLRWGIVLLGFKISAVDLLDVGASGLAVALVTVFVTYAFTMWLGHRLGLERDLVGLVAAGFSICGAAAIAAVSDAVRGKERHVGLAIALVTVYGSIMIVALPVLASWMGLTDRQAAVWAGASIHEVAQVIATASILGSSVVVIATTVKLARVLLLAPVYILATRTAGNDETAARKLPLVPWFVIGFVVTVAIRSTGAMPGPALDVAQFTTTLLLAAGMFGLGMAIRLKEIWPIPPAALALASASTVVAAGTSLTLVVALV